jgi:hypothetical protein
VKLIGWSREKNDRLQRDRGVSFEEVVLSMATGGLLDVLHHTNPRRYGNQMIFVVRIGAYAYLVPFVETAEEIFLKTIIPSRKATREYLREETPDA